VTLNLERPVDDATFQEAVEAARYEEPDTFRRYAELREEIRTNEEAIGQLETWFGQEEVRDFEDTLGRAEQYADEAETLERRLRRMRPENPERPELERRLAKKRAQLDRAVEDMDAKPAVAERYDRNASELQRRQRFREVAKDQAATAENLRRRAIQKQYAAYRGATTKGPLRPSVADAQRKLADLSRAPRTPETLTAPPEQIMKRARADIEKVIDADIGRLRAVTDDEGVERLELNGMALDDRILSEEINVDGTPQYTTVRELLQEIEEDRLIAQATQSCAIGSGK